MNPVNHNPEDVSFDVEGAARERIAWRVGAERPTERALGLDESLARTNRETEQSARQAKLEARLGGIASQEIRPEDS